MPYIPGDNWCICDISGKKILQSRSVKTWDGLRVDPDYWYPRHPQLDVRGIPDHMAVTDGRPRPTDLIYGVHASGWFTLFAPNGTRYGISISNLGVISAGLTLYGNSSQFMSTGDWYISVANDGSIRTTQSPGMAAPTFTMTSPNGTVYTITVNSTGTIVATP